MTAAISRACSTTRWRWPISPGLRPAAAASAAQGRLRGLGLVSFLEVTAPPGKEMGALRFEPDGRVTMTTGTLDYGQGHGTAFAQVLVDRLGLRIRPAAPGPGRQRRADRRRRLGRLALDHVGGTALIRAARGGRRAQPPSGRPCTRSRPGRCRVRAAAASPSSAPTGRSVSWISPPEVGTEPALPADLPQTLDVGLRSKPPRRPFPMAVMPSRSRSIRKPGWSRSCAMSWSMISARW